MTTERTDLQYQAQAAANLETFKAVIDAGNGALQSLILVNGGAVVALLALFSELLGEENDRALAYSLTWSLLWFGIGSVMGAFGYGFRYLSQDATDQSTQEGDKSSKKATIWRLFSIGSAVIGYLLLLIGVITTFATMRCAFAP